MDIAHGPPVFSQLLRQYRLAAGLTQAELAERARLSVRGVSDLERGARHFPRQETVALLADALHLSNEDRATFLTAARRVMPLPPTPSQSRNTHAPFRLPIPPTPLLGRESEVARLRALLRQEAVRLVTITGPPGVGKTHLALAAAADLSGDFTNGVWFIRLASVSDPALVLATIAHTLGLQQTGNLPVMDLLRANLYAQQMLLLLDNCEQVVEAAPQLADLLATSPRLRVLVTSRKVLHVRGEYEMPIAPLALPPFGPDPEQVPSLEQVRQSPAAALFLQRAQAVRPDFALNSQTAGVVAEICARLDGLPLAIELAAARVKLLPPAELLQRLERQLPVLTGGARDQPVHQQTLRATLAWSEGLLQPEERRLFRRLAVFVGSWTLEAAEAVCAAPAGATPLGMNVMDGLEALLDQSLVQHSPVGDGKGRFRLLYVVREYALERLEEGEPAGAEAEALSQAHLCYYLDLMERQELAVYGRGVASWVNRLMQEYDNFRGALDWARKRGMVELGLRLASALATFWDLKGYHAEGRDWLEGLLALADEGGNTSAVSELTRAKALLGVGMFARRAGNYEQARIALETCLALVRGRRPDWIAGLALGHLGHIARRQGDLEKATAYIKEGLALLQESGEPVAGVFLSDLGQIRLVQGDLDQAGAYFEESLALARRIGADFWAGFPLAGLAQLALARGDLERAAAYFERSLKLTRRVGSDFWTGHVLAGLARIARQRGDLAGATRLAREQLAAWRRLGVPTYLAGCLEGIGLVAAAAGQGMDAARLLGAAAAWRERVGEAQTEEWRAEIEQAIVSVQATLSTEEWAAAFEGGRALTLEEAISEALDETSAAAAQQHDSRSQGL